MAISKKNISLVISIIVLIYTIVNELQSNNFSSLLPLETPIPSTSPINLSSATSSAVSGIEGERAFVLKVIDGDTIELADSRRVRYIGIDTPETVDPRRPVGCFGKQAKEENKILVEGKEVIIQKDISETDKYDRILRYVFLPLDNGGTLFVNDYLIRQGFANVLTYPPDVKYNQRFLEAQESAKNKRLGLWGSCEQ